MTKTILAETTDEISFANPESAPIRITHMRLVLSAEQASFTVFITERDGTTAHTLFSYGTFTSGNLIKTLMEPLILEAGETLLIAVPGTIDTIDLVLQYELA